MTAREFSSVLYASVSGKSHPFDEEKTNDQSQQGKCTDWKAWHDSEPGTPATLHVIGNCEFSTGGYKVELKPAKPQGANPKICILEKIVHPPTGPAPDVVTHVEVRYTEKTNTHYDEVLILPDKVTVPVKEVS